MSTGYFSPWSLLVSDPTVWSIFTHNHKLHTRFELSSQLNLPRTINTKEVLTLEAETYQRFFMPDIVNPNTEEIQVSAWVLWLNQARASEFHDLLHVLTTPWPYLSNYLLSEVSAIGFSPKSKQEGQNWQNILI